MTVDKQKKRRGPITLTTTLTVVFVLLSVVPLLITGGVVTVRNFQVQQQVAASRERQNAQQAANEVSNFLEQIINILETAATVENPFSGTVDEQETLLDKLMGTEPAFLQLSLLDERGQELVKRSRLRMIGSEGLTNRANSDLFIQTTQNVIHLSSVHIDETSGEPLITVGVPVKNVFDEVQGVLVADVNLKFMWDLVSALQIGTNGVAYVVDRQGNLIAFNDTSRVLQGENVSNLSPVADFTGDTARTNRIFVQVSTGINGNQVLSTYVPLERPDWAVVVELPIGEAYRAVFIETALTAAGVLIVAILAGVAGVYLSRRLAAPVQDLTETATRIAGGEIELEAPLQGTAEVSTLAEAFNSMTIQLREMLGSLEDQVRERTAELTLSMEVGQQASATRDLNELLSTIAEFIRSQFELYYTHIYMVDHLNQNLMIKSGTGTVGQQLLARRHSLPIGPGSIVGRVAAEGRTIVVSNTDSSDIHKPNPLLPDTKSEIAIPLIVNEQVIGVLDLQDDEVETFTEHNVTVFEAMATQLAIAIDSAQQWSAAQEAQHQLEQVIRRLTRESWGTTLAGRKAPLNFVYDLQEIKTADSANVDNGGVSVPVAIQNEPIGQLSIQPPTDRRLTTDEHTLLAEVAQQLAQKAENLRLFEDTQRQALREQITRQIVDKIRTSRDIETALKTAAEELNKSLSTAKAVINLRVNPQHHDADQEMTE